MDNGDFSGGKSDRSAPVPVIMPTSRNATHYNMYHRERGIALIFNHENFDLELGLPKRIGTNIDAESISKTLYNLDFNVTVHNDLKYTELTEVIAKAAARDHTNYDCFIMVVLSHGAENNILDCYDRSYYFNELWTPFSANVCTSLAGKPKIFFVQACRGNRYMAPVFLSITETDGPSNFSITGYNIPSEADFLFAFSTIPGYYSWRNTVLGTWFIQALCKVLKESAYKYDILTILTFVNQIVAIDYETNIPAVSAAHQRKQIPTIESRLTRLLQFNSKSNNLDNAQEVIPWQPTLYVEFMKNIIMHFMNENASINYNEVERVWNNFMNRLNSCGSGHCKEVWIEIFSNLISVTKWKTGTKLTPLENDSLDVGGSADVMGCPASIEESLNQFLGQVSPLNDFSENESIIQKQKITKDLAILLLEVKRKELDLRERELEFKIQKMNSRYLSFNSESSEESD